MLVSSRRLESAADLEVCSWPSALIKSQIETNRAESCFEVDTNAESQFQVQIGCLNKFANGAVTTPRSAIVHKRDHVERLLQGMAIFELREKSRSTPEAIFLVTAYAVGAADEELFRKRNLTDNMAGVDASGDNAPRLVEFFRRPRRAAAKVFAVVDREFRKEV